MVVIKTNGTKVIKPYMTTLAQRKAAVDQPRGAATRRRGDEDPRGARARIQ